MPRHGSHGDLTPYSRSPGRPQRDSDTVVDLTPSGEVIDLLPDNELQEQIRRIKQLMK